MKIVVLGAGLVGSAIIQDLAQDNQYEILAVDLSKQALESVSGFSGVSTSETDLSDKKVIKKQDRKVGIQAIENMKQLIR